MFIDAKIMQGILDSNDQGMTDSQIVGALAARSLEAPGAFWSAISVRSLGKRRLKKLEQLSILASASGNKDVAAFGVYASAVFELARGIVTSSLAAYQAVSDKFLEEWQMKLVAGDAEGAKEAKESFELVEESLRDLKADPEGTDEEPKE